MFLKMTVYVLNFFQEITQGKYFIFNSMNLTFIYFYFLFLKYQQEPRNTCYSEVYKILIRLCNQIVLQ